MMPVGPLMVFLQSTELVAGERELLQHPAVGGVIFFPRNYKDKEKLSFLISQIREADPDLILAVDHEGGQVQRFKRGFTRLPPMRRFGQLFDRDPQQALRLIRATGWLVSLELREVGVHTGFSPVLDLFGANKAIGDRALHAVPEVVVQLGGEFIKGLHDGGLLPVGKHFPGHGTVSGDTHDAVVKDDRPRAQIEATDLKVFHDLITSGMLTAVMATHVAYPQVDAPPASSSGRWLKEILRQEIGFQGIVFSDDLAMQGICSADGDVSVRRMLEAGCDMVLICHDSELLQRALDELPSQKIHRRAEALGERWEPIRRRLEQASAGKRWDAETTREELRTLTGQFENN